MHNSLKCLQNLVRGEGLEPSFRTASQVIEITKIRSENKDFYRISVSILFNPIQPGSTQAVLPVFFAESQGGAS